MIPGGKILRRLVALEPATVADIQADTGLCNKYVQQALAAGMDRGLVWRRPLRRGRFRVNVYRTTELGRADCECGRPKQIDEEACSHCAYLDGDGREALVIDSLRGTDGLSVLEICIELGMNTDYSNGRRDLLRTVQSLMDQQRIRRYWREDQSTQETARHQGFGNGSSCRAPIGCWAYALDGKTKREWARRAA